MAAAGLPLTALLAGCMPQASPTAAKPDMHNSRNSLDWAGTYEGVLPCADCPGIRTTLTLARDGSYTLAMQYIDRSVAPVQSRGRFSWNDAGGAIVLEGDGRRFMVGEGRLVQLDRDGAPLPNTTQHVLQKRP
jgi:uncharacterized lipoprotein NlpE involved in copper resistance